MNDIEGERAKSSLAMVNHEDGGVFVYATPGKGIQGDKCWVPKRLAKDIDNCGTRAASVQIKSDQEPAVSRCGSAGRKTISKKKQDRMH